MNRNVTLTVASLLAILLFTFHFADDIARGFEQGDLGDYTGILIVAAWLYATLALGHRRAGLAVMLLFSLGAAVVPALHMSGAGMTGARISGTDSLFFWWTLIALGATGLVCSVLAALRLLSLRTGNL